MTCTLTGRLLPLPLLVLITLLLTACDPAPGPSATTEVAAKGLYSGAISPSGDYFVIGSIYHGGSLWSSRGERLFNWNHKAGERSAIVATDFSPDGQWAVTAEDQTLVLWSATTGKAVVYLSAPAQILDVALGQNGNYALVGTTGNEALLYNLRQRSVVRVLNHANTVRSVALSDDGRLALTGSEDTTAVLWDLESGRPLFTIKHQDDVQQVALSPDGRLALSAAQYDKAVLWRTSNGEVIGELPLAAEHLKRGSRFTAAEFSANSSLLLTGSPDRVVQLWDTARLSLVKEWHLPKRNAWKPTGAAVVAVGFGPGTGVFQALSANGFQHELRR
ncbi:hypothetical protein [Halioxenophilus sp. WMMB6]|uniref:WD40 repeat domain-containing protein n=1 Tax=Halioxenophilus sp. WMMB6 TaxID=3073815 RepID=UPI00295E83E9|nr:hypothetical protein [Halioxenophilus sp. WMMB6]